MCENQGAGVEWESLCACRVSWLSGAETFKEKSLRWGQLIDVCSPEECVQTHIWHSTWSLLANYDIYIYIIYGYCVIHTMCGLWYIWFVLHDAAWDTLWLPPPPPLPPSPSKNVYIDCTCECRKEKDISVLYIKPQSCVITKLSTNHVVKIKLCVLVCGICFEIKKYFHVLPTTCRDFQGSKNSCWHDWFF